MAESITSEWFSTPYSSQTRHSSIREVAGREAEPERYSFLSFLATAQALQIEFLPIPWQSARQSFGLGGTSNINEGQMDIDISLAFKRIRGDVKRSTTEERIYRNLINELVVLGQPFIRQHRTIAQLQGITWDVSSFDDTPWPVLVFRKTQFGDLFNFMSLPVGRNMTFDDRLKLCQDIGIAIIDMHRINIIHGDLKPENILIFKEDTGEFSGKVTDFGYSTRFTDDNQRLTLPISPPWNAPEHDRLAREWTPLQAIRADIFSFGMLCLWILFETRTSEAGVVRDRLGELKTELQIHSRLLLQLETALSDNKRAVLETFFTSSLSMIPEERDPSLEHMLKMLNSGWAPSEEGVLKIKDYNAWSIDFKVERSLEEFYNHDFRLRSYIAQCLISERPRVPQIGIQVAFCYYIGFGVIKDENQAMKILEESNETLQVLKDMTSNSGPDIFSTSMMAELNSVGRVGWTDFGVVYLQQHIITEAVRQLRRDIKNLTAVYSAHSPVIEIAKIRLANVYGAENRWEEQEELYEELVKMSRKRQEEEVSSGLLYMTSLAATKQRLGRWAEAEEILTEAIEISLDALGAEHSTTLAGMNNLAMLREDQGKLGEAAELLEEVMELRGMILGEEHLDTLLAMNNLSAIYWRQNQLARAEQIQVQAVKTAKVVLGEAHPLTADLMGNLACTLGNQGRIEDAEDLELRVVNARKQLHGEDHQATLIATGNLAMTYSTQGRWDEAEELQSQVLERLKGLLGEEHDSTLAGMGNLAATLCSQGRWQEAEGLETHVLETRRRIHGKDHPDTLVSMHNLAYTYKALGRSQDATALMRDCFSERQRVLGLDDLDTMASSNALREWDTDDGGKASVS